MKRLYTLLLILVLTLGFSASALAQDVNCGDLSQEDCDLVLASQTAMTDITSQSQVIEVNAEILGVPTVPGDLTFDFSLETSVSSSDEAAQLASDLQTMSANELADLYASPEELADLMVQLLQGTQANMALSLNMSDDLVALLNADPTVTIPSTLDLNLALVDGVLYVDTSTLGPLLEGQMGGMAGLSGWIGVEVGPLLRQSLMQSTTDPATASAVAMSTASTSNAAGPVYGQLAAVDPSGAWLQFLNIERLEDQDGNAVFETTIDWETLLASDYFGQLVSMVLLQNGIVASQAEVGQMVELARAFAPAVLQDLSLTLTEQVGLDDNYLVDSSFIFDLDLSNILSMAGGTGVETAEDAAVYVEVNVANSDINADLGIEAPSNAFVVPAEMLQQMMSGGM